MYVGIRQGAAVAALLASLMLNCSRFDDSTSLGGGIVEDVNPGKLSLDAHFRRYVMDPSAVDSAFSLPSPGDRGFGIHQVAGGYMVIGNDGTDSSVGHVSFPVRADTSRFTAADTLESVVLLLTRDSAGNAGGVTVRHLDSLPDFPTPSRGDSVGELLFAPQGETAAIIDSIVMLPGTSFSSLADSIFDVCLGNTQDTLSRFGFLLVKTVPSGTVRLRGNPTLRVKFRRGGEDSLRQENFGPEGHVFYVAADSRSDSLRQIPALSYASERTAVYEYDLQGLWDTASAGLDDPRQAQIISAVFSLHRPQAADTITLRCLLWPSLLHDGIRLDSLLAGSNPSATPVIVVLPGAEPVEASQRKTLAALESMGNQRPAKAYLYLRIEENVKERWQRTVFSVPPLLTAVITIP